MQPERRRLATRFEELICWQEARRLTRVIYTRFQSCRDFSFRDQICRASVSVMNNIAEGFERATRKDFARFLDQAKGSSGEVRSMLYAATDLGYVGEEDAGDVRAALQQALVVRRGGRLLRRPARPAREDPLRAADRGGYDGRAGAHREPGAADRGSLEERGNGVRAWPVARLGDEPLFSLLFAKLAN